MARNFRRASATATAYAPHTPPGPACGAHGIKIPDQICILGVDNDEMLHVRLENVRHLLATTNRAIDDITRASGWENAVPLKILFKKRFGMSMRDWRETQRGFGTATPN